MEIKKNEFLPMKTEKVAFFSNALAAQKAEIGF
jgi:hypothetical protein